MHKKNNYSHGKYLFLFVNHGRMEYMGKVYYNGYKDVEKKRCELCFRHAIYPASPWHQERVARIFARPLDILAQ